MFLIIYFFPTLISSVTSPSDGSVAELIEKCPSPWSSYNTRASPSKCQNQCNGKAFHAKDGKLICFNLKDQSYLKPIRGKKKSKNITCECVYIIPRIKSKWLPCENSTLEATQDICEEICKRTTVYLYKRGHVRAVLLCENEERTEYYDMVGHNGKVIYYKNSTSIKHRECTCGIASTESKPVAKDEKLKLTNSAVSFQKCSEPWETLKLWTITNLETCEIQCEKVCKRGSGIIREGEAFCFTRHATAKKRTPFHGAIEGACECGYTKKNSELEFIPCNPPITRNGISGKKCDQFCTQTTAYTHRKLRQPLNIRCIYKPGMKPKPLVGKCDERTYREMRNNIIVNYTKCSCGVEKLLDSNISRKQEIENNVTIKLPDSWVVKKKRSIRLREKLPLETKSFF